MPLSFGFDWYGLTKAELLDQVAASQLPFGFDGGWYACAIFGGSVCAHKSQLPFGFDGGWYCVAEACTFWDDPESQLPFGFDVGWYWFKGLWRRCPRWCHNCLSALMSVGTRKKRQANKKICSSHNCLSALMSVGTLAPNGQGKPVEKSQLPFGFEVVWYG